MEILTLDKVSFNWEDMISRPLGKRENPRRLSPDILEAAEKSYSEGVGLLEMRAALEYYEVVKTDLGSGKITITLHGGSDMEELYIGPRIEYLRQAKELAVVLCTAGKPIVDAMDRYSKNEEYLMAHYINAFGVMALAELYMFALRRIETRAQEMEWGVGPSMQPGSVAGWGVEGQKDIYRLAHGEQLGLVINDGSFLIPQISDSAVIGVGPDYETKTVGSMCHECPRRDTCPNRRETETL